MRTRIEPHGVARSQVHSAQRVGQLADDLLVGATDDDRPHTIVEDLADRDDVAGTLGGAGRDHVETLVENHFGTARQGVDVDFRMQIHAHLATTRENVDRSVVVLAHHHAVGRRRLREFVDLVAK